MQRNNNPIKLSYYRLTLLSYLKDSHPELAADTSFIKNRADAAAQTYAQAILDGLSHPGAEGLANITLFNGLLFSKQDTIINVLWNEFSEIIAQSQAKEIAQQMLPLCEPIFLQYALSDEFMYSKEYDQLYTELTGFIDLWLQGDGIQ